jgi:hypothetical protein
MICVTNRRVFIYLFSRDSDLQYGEATIYSTAAHSFTVQSAGLRACSQPCCKCTRRYMLLQVAYCPSCAAALPDALTAQILQQCPSSSGCSSVP